MILRVLVVILTLFAATPIVSADETAEEAQQLLTQLGYDVGSVDGRWGRKSGAQLAMFLQTLGEQYDGKLDDSDIALLRQAAAPYTVELKRPGSLFDVAAARANSCFALDTGRFNPRGLSGASYPPILAFDDSKSIGASVKYDGLIAWGKTVVVLAAAGGLQGDEQAAKVAKELLLSWAEAGAGLATRIDRRYLGAGNAEDYDAEAAAPVLDMQNALILANIGFVGAALLNDQLTRDESAVISSWTAELFEKFGRRIFNPEDASNGVYLTPYYSLLGAIARGDSEAYRSLVEGYYRAIRSHTDENGAILKNANRGDRALHYQGMGILAVMAVIEAVENQGGLAPPDIYEDLHRAVAFFLDATRDRNVILPYAKVGFNNPGRGKNMEMHYLSNAEQYWWMVDYVSRFPTSDNGRRLRVLIADNDTSELVDRNILASNFVPYPINCFRKFETSEAAIAEARAFVDTNYPKVEHIEFEGGFGLGKPKVKDAQPISLKLAKVVTVEEARNYNEFVVSLFAANVGKISRSFVEVPVMADFAGGTEPGNLNILRLAVMRNKIGSAESQEADYLECGEVAAQRMDWAANEQQLRLHIGRGIETNDCILDKMSEEDRAFWGAVLANFESILKDAQGEEQRDRLLSLYRQMVY